ncbi:MAG TPA: PorV/PorQ family protein [Candidatus Eisenbacteria bacterium]|nr:PorV/PorQ family protein [Candidatus Eisenbacteria bacterium]
MFRTHRQLAAALVATALVMNLGASASAATAENGGTPGSWLSSYVSARALGLGGAYVGAADDAASVVWNPAGLAMLVPNELRFETAQLFEDTSVNSFNFAVPGNKLPSFGLSIISLQSGAFDRTNEMNDPLGTFNEGETAYLFTIARNISPRLALGTNVKLVRQTVENFSAGGVGFDLGSIYDVSPNLRVGFSVQNLGGPNVTLRDTKETYPVEFRGGFAATLFNGRGLITAELDQASGPGTRIRGGSEYWVQPMLALRAGYNENAPGGGLSYRFSGKYQFDYGVLDHPLGLTHRIGLSYRFGGFFASAKASPEVFSPTGETAVTKISLNARTKAEPDSWTLKLLNKSDETVRTFGGKGQPPAHLLWDGKDETGLPLPDGIYRYTLEVHDSEGRTIESRTRAIEISTGGPQGSVPVIPVQ